MVPGVPDGAGVAMGDVPGRDGTSDGVVVLQPHEKQRERAKRRIRADFFTIS
jgi:hypothetical protein